MKKLIALLAFLLPTSASGEEILIPEAFKAYKSVNVNFADQVSGGCLPNPSSAQKAFEIELLKAGIKVEDEGLPIVLLNFVGFSQEANSGFVLGCAVSYDVTFIDRGFVITAGTTNNKQIPAPVVIVYRDGGIVTGPKDTIQNQIERTAHELGQTFAVAWLKARQQ